MHLYLADVRISNGRRVTATVRATSHHGAWAKAWDGAELECAPSERVLRVVVRLAAEPWGTGSPPAPRPWQGPEARSC